MLYVFNPFTMSADEGDPPLEESNPSRVIDSDEDDDEGKAEEEEDVTTQETQPEGGEDAATQKTQPGTDEEDVQGSSGADEEDDAPAATPAPTPTTTEPAMSTDEHRRVALYTKDGAMTRADALEKAKKDIALNKMRFSYGSPHPSEESDSSDSDEPGVAQAPAPTPAPSPSPAPDPAPKRKHLLAAKPSPAHDSVLHGLREEVSALQKHVVTAKNDAIHAARAGRALAAKAQADGMARDKQARDLIARHKQEWESRASKLGEDIRSGDVTHALSDAQGDITQLRSELRAAEAAGEGGIAQAKAFKEQIQAQTKRIDSLQSMRELGAQHAKALATLPVPEDGATSAVTAASDEAVVAAKRRAESVARQLHDRQQKLRRHVANNSNDPPKQGGELSESDSGSDSDPGSESDSDNGVRPPDLAARDQLLPTPAPASVSIPTPAPTPAPAPAVPKVHQLRRRALPTPKPIIPPDSTLDDVAVKVGEASSGEEGEVAPLIKARKKKRAMFDDSLGERKNKPKDKMNLFDKFMEYAAPSFNDEFNGFLQLTMIMLIIQCLSFCGVLVFCIVREEYMYWQLNVYSYHDLKVSWSAAFGWVSLVEAGLGVVYQGFVFGMRRRMYNPSALEGSSIDPSNIPHRKLDKDAENYWWFAGAVFGIFDSCVLVFMGANGLMTMIDFISLGLVAWYIIKQADSRYDLLTDRVAIENLSMAIGMKLYVIARIIAMYAISSSGSLETSWAGNDMAVIFFLYVIVMFLALFMVMGFRRSPLFPLVRDVVMLMVTVCCSWMVATASTDLGSLPGVICSISIAGC